MDSILENCKQEFWRPVNFWKCCLSDTLNNKLSSFHLPFEDDSRRCSLTPVKTVLWIVLNFISGTRSTKGASV
jgi:hypothetical protein